MSFPNALEGHIDGVKAPWAVIRSLHTPPGLSAIHQGLPIFLVAGVKEVQGGEGSSLDGLNFDSRTWTTAKCRNRLGVVTGVR